MKSAVKTQVTKARRAMGESSTASSERTAATTEAVSALDRAASKRVLHKNNAARRKARLMRQLARLGAAEPVAPAPVKGRRKTAAAPAAPAAAAAPAKKGRK
jgi:small subunit ribosomal protein S20